MAIILDGRAIGAEIKAELRADIEKYVHELGRPPGLFIVRVGGDTASGVYSKAILRVAEEIGVKARLDQFPTRISADELRSILMRLNCDETVQGIIVQMPLPGHLSQKMVADMISSSKDIDGISPRSAGNLFLGLPSFLPVTVSHSHTVNLAGFTRQADVLVAAAGHANMITSDMVRPGAIVIDVGINELPGGGIVGDVDFTPVSEVAGAITPTPGGVGPLTNILLLKQCVHAAWQQVQDRGRMLGEVSIS